LALLLLSPIPKERDMNPIPHSLSILVEEDSRVRRVWSNHFRANEQSLLTFEYPSEFLTYLDSLAGSSERIWFYLDQDFGSSRGVGLELARRIRALLDNDHIALVTSYPRELLSEELKSGLTDAVFPKYPQETFGDLYDGSCGPVPVPLRRNELGGRVALFMPMLALALTPRFAQPA